MKKMKRITAWLLSAAMAASLSVGMSFSALAATNADPVRDLSTILGSSTVIGANQTSGKLKLVMQSGNAAGTLDPDLCAGAEFTAYPLVDFSMGGVDGKEIIGYTLENASFWTSIGITSVNDLQDALNSTTDPLTNTKLVSKLRGYTGTLTPEPGATATVVTGTNYAEFSSLPFGFYYVAQTTASTGGIISSAPILVSLPYSDTDVSGTTTWYGDLTAYAKTSLPNILSQILNKSDTMVTPADPTAPNSTTEGAWSEETSQSAGTTAYFRTEMEFPQYTLTGMDDLDIAKIMLAMGDELTSNLVWDKNSVKVMYTLSGSATETPLSASYYDIYDADTADVTWSDFPTDPAYNTAGMDFMVDFTGNYADIAALAAAGAHVEKLVVYYAAAVKNGITPGNAEKSTSSLTYTNDVASIGAAASTHGTVTTRTGEVSLWSFGIAIDKYRKNSESVKLEGATFTVSDTLTSSNTYWFIPTAPGAYSVAYVGTPTTGTPTCYTDATYTTTAATGVTTDYIKYTGTFLNDNTTASIYNAVRTNAGGVLKIDGVDDADYELTEVAAPAGYNKLTAPVTVKVFAVRESGGIKLTGKVDDTVNSVADNGDAYADLGVENSNGIELPSTGGVGTILFTLAGLAILLGCVVVVVSTKAKRRYSEK